MVKIVASRKINAPVDRVFKRVSEIEKFVEVDDDIVHIEFLTEQKSGIGTRFRETRKMKKQEMITELEVTEYVENDHVRMVTDSHGTIWDTIYEVKSEDGQTGLTLTMDATPHQLLPKIMNRFMKGFFQKGIERHMDAVKTYCEA